MNLIDLNKHADHIGMLQQEKEVLMLTGFLAALRPVNIMEIGTWKGGLFYTMCQMAPEQGVKISVDLDGYGDFDMGERNRTMRSWASDVRQINASSHDDSTLVWVTSALSGKKLDFLMIDGDHSKGGVRLDHWRYGPLVRPGGWIGFHDIVESEKHVLAGCEVAEYWQQITGHKIEISLGVDWGGLGLLQVST